MPKNFIGTLTGSFLLLAVLATLSLPEGTLAAEKLEAKELYVSLDLPDRWSIIDTNEGDNKSGSWWRTALLDREGVASVQLIAKSPIPGNWFDNWSWFMRRKLIREYTGNRLDNVDEDDKKAQFQVTLGPGRTATATTFIVNTEGYYDHRVIFIPFALYSDPDEEQDGPWYMLFIYNRGQVAEDISRDVIKTILRGIKLYPPETAVGQ